MGLYELQLKQKEDQIDFFNRRMMNQQKEFENQIRGYEKEINILKVSGSGPHLADDYIRKLERMEHEINQLKSGRQQIMGSGLGQNDFGNNKNGKMGNKNIQNEKCEFEDFNNRFLVEMDEVLPQVGIQKVTIGVSDRQEIENLKQKVMDLEIEVANQNSHRASVVMLSQKHRSPSPPKTIDLSEEIDIR